MNEVAQDPFIGQTVGGKYKIVRLIGEGGMGCVYLGEQALGTATRKVAVKTLHKHLSHDPAVKARFTREVETVAALNHPNTIQVFDYGETPDGTLYIVMEFVQGRALADVLEKEGAMPMARVEKILTQVVGSLQEAHDHGIVHRDLKPDNIVLCDRGGQKDWVEVLDFGIAKRSSEVDEKEAKLTQQGMVLGTPPYMSPEQFTGQPIDVRSDVYALGVMTYEMLTGRLPFMANTPWEWASQHMTAQPVPFEMNQSPNMAPVPASARGAVMRALSKRADERFNTVTEFLEAFKTGAGAEMAMPAPASAGTAGRAKTEMASPAMMPMGGGTGTGQAPAYNMSPMPPPVAAGGGYGPAPGPAPQAGFIPVAPGYQGAPQGSSARDDDGGSRKGLLMAAGGVAALTVLAVVLLIAKPWKKEANNGPLELGSGGTTTSSMTQSVPDPTTPPATDTAPPLNNGTLPPLNAGTSSGATPHNPGTNPAHTAAQPVPTLKPPANPGPTQQPNVTPVPTLKPPATVTPPPPPPPPARPAICIEADRNPTMPNKRACAAALQAQH